LVAVPASADGVQMPGRAVRAGRAVVAPARSRRRTGPAARLFLGGRRRPRRRAL